jgi:hypothetical protein
MTDELEIHHQASFGSDGEIVVAGTTETSLDQFGVDIDHRDPDSRIDRPEASQFGIDDRPTDTNNSGDGVQSPLVAPELDTQETLDGDDPPSPFESQ